MNDFWGTVLLLFFCLTTVLIFGPTFLTGVALGVASGFYVRHYM